MLHEIQTWNHFFSIMSAPEFEPNDGEVSVTSMYGDSWERLLLKSIVFLLLTVLGLKRTESTFMQIA
jgi:hypothetical protein